MLLRLRSCDFIAFLFPTLLLAPAVAAVELSTPAAAHTAFQYATSTGLIDTSDANVAGEQVGKAVLSIIAGNDDVQQSNYNWGSFQLENVGGKRIAAVFVDVTQSIFSDVVFDNDGSGGDSVAKTLNIDFGVTETLPVSIDDYKWQWLDVRDDDPDFEPTDPFDPNQLSNVNNLFVNEAGDSGTGADGGFRGELLLFGTFVPGEKIGFSGDMDPNSLAGLHKGTVDDGSGWDVGGVSGAEMIHSVVSILFGDGSTASGTIASDGSQAGGVAVISQGDTTTAAPVLTVNGLTDGETGIYNANRPTVVVSSNPGDIVLVSMVKGFNPVVNSQDIANGQTTAAELVEARLQAQYPEFPVNNAKLWQHVLAEIPASGSMDLSIAFNYDENLPIAFVAVVQDTQELPLSATSKPIRLLFGEEPTAPNTCGVQNFQNECTTTRGCQAMYSGSYDCWNGGGGTCLCGEGDACGCTQDAVVVAPPVTAPVQSPPSNSCGLIDFQTECTTTRQCKGMYTGADDCFNGGGGVCLCDGEVCGCREQATCGLQDFQSECTTTGQCRGMYAGAYDCSNSGGGVCLCGNAKACGCL